MARIDLDANATTPVLPEVIAAMLPYFTSASGNPSAAHRAGQRTRSAVERARGQVATLLNAAPQEIVFTSGGTESNNFALFGALQPFVNAGQTAHLITTAMEHHAVLYPAEELARRGIAVTFLRPAADGRIEPEAFAAALRPETRLVSIMLANNETGTVQPLGKLARLAKEFAAAHGTALYVHTDAVQAAGKLPLDLAGEFKNVDLLSLSGHKMYAPQGTGVLFVRKGMPLTPLMHGGPHERQRRAGTENVPGIVALGLAAELAGEWLRRDQSQVLAGAAERLAALRYRLEAGLLAAIPGTVVNGSVTHRVPNTTNLRFGPLPGEREGVDAEALLIALDMQGVAASFGAACQSGATEPSHVLLAMGLTAAEARSSLRLSLSRLTTGAEIDRALEIIPAAVARLRSVAA